MVGASVGSSTEDGDNVGASVDDEVGASVSLSVGETVGTSVHKR